VVLKVFEHTLNQQISEYSVPIGVNNLYSKYSIAPLNSINFGAMQFSTMKSRKIEIRNDGLFEFI